MRDRSHKRVLCSGAPLCPRTHIGVARVQVSSRLRLVSRVFCESSPHLSILFVNVSKDHQYTHAHNYRAFATNDESERCTDAVHTSRLNLRHRAMRTALPAGHRSTDAHRHAPSRASSMGAAARVAATLAAPPAAMLAVGWSAPASTTLHGTAAHTAAHAAAHAQTLPAVAAQRRRSRCATRAALLLGARAICWAAAAFATCRSCRRRAGASQSVHVVARARADARGRAFESAGAPCSEPFTTCPAQVGSTPPKGEAGSGCGGGGAPPPHCDPSSAHSQAAPAGHIW